MSMFTTKLLDGYVLNNTDGYTVVTDWQDVHSSPFFSISTLFSGSNPNGTLSLQCSNDQSSDETSRGIYGSSQFVASPLGVGVASKSYPVSAGSPQGTPKDANTVTPLTTTQTTTGTVTWVEPHAGYRWVRVVWTPIADTNTTIDIYMHRKSQINRQG